MITVDQLQKRNYVCWFLCIYFNTWFYFAMGKSFEVDGGGEREKGGTLPLITPPLSTEGWLQKLKKVEQREKIIETEKEKNVPLHANISDTPFDQKFPRPPEEGVLNCHRQTNKQTDRHTYGHRDSMTESVKRRCGLLVEPSSSCSL